MVNIQFFIEKAKEEGVSINQLVFCFFLWAQKDQMRLKVEMKDALPTHNCPPHPDAYLIIRYNGYHAYCLLFLIICSLDPFFKVNTNRTFIQPNAASLS